MPQRITIPPYDSYGVATMVIHQGTIYLGHFGGSCGDDGAILPSIQEQTRQTFRHLAEALRSVDADLGSLLKVTVILRDIADFDGMHEAWCEIFPAAPPARTTITSQFVDDFCRIQVDGVACLG